MRDNTNEMHIMKWHTHYLVKYMQIISKPKFNQQRHFKYKEKLLEWYGNWDNRKEEYLQSMRK